MSLFTFSLCLTRSITLVHRLCSISFCTCSIAHAHSSSVKFGMLTCVILSRELRDNLLVFPGTCVSSIFHLVRKLAVLFSPAMIHLVIDCMNMASAEATSTELMISDLSACLVSLSTLLSNFGCLSLRDLSEWSYTNEGVQLYLPCLLCDDSPLSGP